MILNKKNLLRRKKNYFAIFKYYKGREKKNYAHDVILIQFNSY